MIKIAADQPSQSPNGLTRLARHLHRPVDVVFAYFNSDGETGYVIAKFGTYFGKLSLHLSQPGGTLRETVLLNEAGAISISVLDDDLLVLIAQGDNRMIRFN